ncbi:MAG: NADPH:quinone oxidoreductase family protein [Bryobacterales bacterium]|nr:NADPH:quinone oxidoreductase family protein [Bryobacterales bacterium]
MKAWRVHDWGAPESMRLEDAPVPAPGPGQVLIQTAACGLNFYDTLEIEGKYQVKPARPFSPGGEVAGTVVAAGSGESRLRPGMRVLSIPFVGGLAEYTLAPANATFPIPDSLANGEAAALPVVYQTSYFSLYDRGQLQPGETLLVHAGASGVGMAGIQLGKARGASVIATASSEAKLEFCRRLGADHVFNYSTPEWVEEVKRVTNGRGADVILDPAGGDAFDLSTKCIAPLGRLLVVGFASGRIPTIAANRILLKNISIVGVLWGNHIAAHPEYAERTHAKLMDLYEAGKIKPLITRTYELNQVVDAFRDMTSRRLIGKAVIRLN